MEIGVIIVITLGVILMGIFLYLMDCNDKKYRKQFEEKPKDIKKSQKDDKQERLQKEIDLKSENNRLQAEAKLILVRADNEEWLKSQSESYVIVHKVDGTTIKTDRFTAKASSFLDNNYYRTYHYCTEYREPVSYSLNTNRTIAREQSEQFISSAKYYQSCTIGNNTILLHSISSFEIVEVEK